MKKLLLVVIGAALIMACGSKKDEQTEQLHPGMHKASVQEVIQGDTYTYVNFKEAGNENWAALSKQEIEKGDVFYYSQALEMKDFHSKEIDKTFDTILFISDISELPTMMGMGHQAQIKAAHKNNQMHEQEVSVDPVNDGVTIKELFSNRDKYAGKAVKIKGQVVKYNPQIMKRNWVHIQDGTKSGDDFDLTVTTDAEVSAGDVVVFEGTIALDKDFGAGYKYDVIMEGAKLVK